MWADGGYAGQFVRVAKSSFKRVVEIVRRCDDVKGFKILPKRWIVERTFSWLGNYRRHDKDHETLPETSVAMIQISMINLMLHRLQPS